MVEGTPVELELTALSALTTASAVRTARDAGVTDMSFQVDEHVRAWEYIVGRANKGADATPGDVLAVCGVELTPDITDVGTLVEELVVQSVDRRTRQLAVRLFEQNLDPRERARQMAGELSSLVTGTARGHERFFDADTKTRLEKVMARTKALERGEMIGWPTGLDVLDNDGDTWKPGEFVLVLAAPNVGKSFLLLKMVAHAYWEADARVLFLSPESTVSDVEDRLDPIIARYMGRTPMSNKALRRGRVDMDEYGEYLTALEARGKSQFVIRDSGDAGVFTVSSIVSLAREHRPDILVVDGFHLIRGDGKSWEAMKQAAEDIKGVVMDMGAVALVGSQVNRDAVLAPDDVPTGGDAAYGMAAYETANRVISMATVRSRKQERVFKLIKHRDGEVITKRQYLHFDVDSGDIRQIKMKDDDEDQIGEHEW